MELDREELLMKLGAARAKAPAAWRLVEVTVAPEDATLSFALDRAKLRQVRRREGRYLVKTCTQLVLDPAGSVRLLRASRLLDCTSVRAFALKPRAFGAPLRGRGA